MSVEGMETSMSVEGMETSRRLKLLPLIILKGEWNGNFSSCHAGTPCHSLMTQVLA